MSASCHSQTCSFQLQLPCLPSFPSRMLLRGYHNGGRSLVPFLLVQPQFACVQGCEHQLALSGSQVAVYISLLLPQTYVDLFQVTGQLINSNDSIAATSTLSHMSTHAPAAYSFIRCACLILDSCDLSWGCAAASRANGPPPWTQ